MCHAVERKTSYDILQSKDHLVILDTCGLPKAKFFNLNLVFDRFTVKRRKNAIQASIERVHRELVL